ncbi:hypothetical protein M2R47_09325, partial [Moraxella sp. Tifton1]|nr:hypothetical protein [Moraxella sp. Tifton1]
MKVNLKDKGGIIANDAGNNGDKGLRVNVDETTIKLNENGQVAAKTTALVDKNQDGKIDDPDNGDSLATAKTVADAINNSGFTLQANGAGDKLVKAGDKVNFVNGDLTTVTLTPGENGQANTIKVDVNAQGLVEKAQLPVVYTDAAGNKLSKKGNDFFGPDGKKVDPADVIASINNGNNDTTQPTNLANVAGNLIPTYNTGDMIVGPNHKLTDNPIMDATKGQEAPQGQDLANMYNNAATVGDVLNAGWNLQANGQAADFVKAYDTVNFIDGEGTKASVITNEDGKESKVKVDVRLDPAKGLEITQAEDGKGGIGIKLAKNAPNPLVVDDNGLGINLDDKTLKVGDANGGNKLSVKTTTLNTTPQGTVELDKNDPVAGDALVNAKTVMSAINNSGFTLKANDEAGKLIKAGDTISIKDGDNINVTQDESGNLTVATKQDVAFETVKVGDTLQ